MTLDPGAKAALQGLAVRYQIPVTWLVNLIRFETAGTFDPKIKNPGSSARGLIQFMDATAKDLGYADSLDLVERNPTVSGQLLGPVREYLDRYRPFPTEQSLYMSVFYPRARDWPLDAEFPAWVRNANPGIRTVRDYVDKVRRSGGSVGGLMLAAFIVAAATILLKTRGKGHA